ncbi:MAG: leucine-rich repeat domain-containing protein [Bacteroidales bacterium]
MKKTWNIRQFAPICISAITLIATLSSCSKEDDTTPEQESIIVSTDTLIFTGTSIAQTFEIESSGKSWAIEISETGKEWLNVNPPAGKSGTTSINVTPQAYSDDFPRFAHLLISKDGDTKKRVGISQSGAVRAESRLQDSLSLVAIYKATAGHNWYGDSRSNEFPWDLAKPLEQWAGIETEVVNGEKRVTTLNLQRVAGMKGSIPNEIGYISELKSLHLAADELVGELPRHITLLTNLKTLYVSAAQSSNLKWELTEEYKAITNLESLTISNVEPNSILTNPLGVIYQLSSIKELTLGLPYVTGSMQSGISNLENLEKLELRMPNINALPSDMGDLKKLKKLTLATHKVSALPTSISNWKTLEELIISNMRSSLVLPSDFKELVNLTTLGLGSLGISFDPNEMLTNMSKLKYIYLNYNNLSGSIDWIAGKPELEMLQIDQNNGVLSGEIPAEIFDYSKLNLFVITSASTAKNNITGNIENIAKLTNLNTFILSNALISGELRVPNSPTLFYFDVSNNNITGGLDNITLVESLYNFIVSGNRLSGEIPQEIHNNMWDYSQGVPPTTEDHYYHASAICPQQSGYGFTNCFSYSAK